LIPEWAKPAILATRGTKCRYLLPKYLLPEPTKSAILDTRAGEARDTKILLLTTMNRILFYTTLSLLAYSSCKPSEKAAKGKSKGNTNITVSVPLGFQVDTLRLFSWQGIQAKEIAIATAPKTEGDRKTFAFEAKNYPEGLYYAGKSLEDVKPFLVGVDKKIGIKVDTAQSARFMSAAFVGSPNNDLYSATIDSINAHGQEFSDLLALYPQAQSSPTELAKLNEQLTALDRRRRTQIESLQKNAPNVARIAALYTYLSYPNNRKTTDETERAYFGRTYFQFANLKDTTYYRLPHFFEAIKNYTTNLSQFGMTPAEQAVFVDTLLASIPETSPQKLPAVLAVAFSYVGRENATFYKYGSLYLSKYKGVEPIVDDFLAKQLPSAMGPLMEGTVAPDFTELMPDGKKLKLSDLRGRIVLIDFWASWCGPCRRENPNVVQAYQKYKDKGFEVLSVSLDTDRQRWLDAIKADNMTWLHVSDLKGWQAAAGKLYGVSGIPFTVLLDKQGKIIGKNLRGAALEAELARIFGK
jgi:thiol-disulfide isomerase/thioredoxin